MADQNMSAEASCKLDELFAMQARLNNHVFKTKSITDHSGNILNMRTIMDDARSDKLTARSLSIEWACKYLTHLQAEAVETAEELPVKFWSDRSVNIDALQEEVIDQLHFWISLAMATGMNSMQVFEKYMEKNAVNIERMDTGYVERIKHGHTTIGTDNV